MDLASDNIFTSDTILKLDDTYLEVSLITPLGEMPCYKASQGFSLSRSQNALGEMCARLNVEVVELGDKDLANTLEMDPPRGLFRFASDEPRASYFPEIIVAKQFANHEFETCVPLQRRGTKAANIGGFQERQLLASMRAAVPLVKDPRARSHFIPDRHVSQSIFDEACTIFDQEQNSAVKLLADLYENTGEKRNALMLALATRGVPAVAALARHDKVDHISEDVAALYRTWGSLIPEDAVVAPGAVPIADTKQARQLMFCLDREDVEAVAASIPRIDAELFESEDGELFQLLVCENPDLETALYHQLDSCDAPDKQCLLLLALGHTESRGRHALAVLSKTLESVALWNPDGETLARLRTDALSSCIQCLASYESSFGEQTQTIAKHLPAVFSAVAHADAHSSFERELKLIMRRLDGYAPYAAIHIQEFVVNTGDGRFQRFWNPQVRVLLRIADSIGGSQNDIGNSRHHF